MKQGEYIASQLKTEADWHRDALARIANTFGVIGVADEDLAESLRDFARDALQCETAEDYGRLFDEAEDSVLDSGRGKGG